MKLRVKVVPGASQTEAVSLEDGVLRVRLNAQPEKGRANRELVLFLAKWLGVSRSSVTLLSGERSRHKELEIEGIEMRDIEAKL